MAMMLVGSMAYAEKIWQFKAVDPDGQLIDVKTLNRQVDIYDLKAIEDDNLHLMNVDAHIFSRDPTNLRGRLLHGNDRYNNKPREQ